MFNLLQWFIDRRTFKPGIYYLAFLCHTNIFNLHILCYNPLCTCVGGGVVNRI